MDQSRQDSPVLKRYQRHDPSKSNPTNTPMDKQNNTISRFEQNHL